MTAKEKYRRLSDTEESIPLFSRSWWLDAVCGASGWEVILIEENNQIVGALPLYKPLQHVVSMPPYTQTMGLWFCQKAPDTKYTTVLGKRQSTCKKIIDELKPYSSFYQLFPYTFTDWLPFYWKGYRQTTRYTYILQSIADKALLWENMTTNIRRNILKAKEKYHITVRKGIDSEAFFNVIRATYHRQRQSPPKDLAVLERLIKICRQRNQGDLWGGYDETGKLHAAAFVVWQTRSAYYIAGGGNPEHRESGAHSLVLWEAIQYVSQYTSTFDFEGSMLPGVERFFREFGGKQMPFFTIRKGNLSLLDKVRMKLCARFK
ncbi:MAG: GNAT family N-acetyltransferase [Massilibacteroides sp.]|nr:GNAT family N-acetyltransferase [Massilibacteroides sp.]